MATDRVSKNTSMKMSQLAEAADLPVSTIKFYVSRGLLPPPEKSKPNVAYYDARFLKRLMIVKKMRSEGLAISSIKSILDRYPFEKVAEWEAFKKKAKSKDSFERGQEERLAALSGEQRRTEAILDSAFEVFSAKGYHNATVDDIAQNAGISKGTCYQYFSGKEDIFLATMDRTVDRLMAEAEAAADGATDPLQRLGLKGLTFISKYRDLQFMFIGVFTEVMGGNERLRKKAAGVYERVAGFLSRDLDDGVTRKAFRDLNTTEVAYAMIGIAEVAGYRQLIEDDFDVLQFFLDLMDFIQHGLSVGP